MRIILFVLFLFFSGFGFAQVPDQEEMYIPLKVEKDSINYREIPFEKKNNDTLIKTNDLKYREDQFYLILSYNLLQNRTGGIRQNAFSSGVNVGFLRDFPINKKRDIAVAVGAGYSFNNFRTNLHISKVNNKITYEIAEDFDKSKLSIHYIDIPIEFRWRTSTPKNTKFWRVYSGFKVSFLTSSVAKITGNNIYDRVTNNSDLNNIRYSAYLSIGHGNINIFANYYFTPLFDTAKLDGQNINMTSLNLGIAFYLL